MNILIYNSNEPLPEQGGMERVTDLLARALSERGINVVLLFRRRNRLNHRYEAPVEIHQLSEESAQSDFVNLVKYKAIDIVIDQTEGGIIGPTGIFKSKQDAIDKTGGNLRFVAVQHSSAKSYIDNMHYVLLKGHVSGFTASLSNKLKQIFYLPIKRAHARSYTRRKFESLNDNYDRVVTLSPSFIAEFLHFCPNANREKLIAIPDLNTFEKTNTSVLKKKVLFVGRLMINPKGVDRLLRIWKKVETSCPEWSLDIVGDGDDRAYLEAMAQELELAHVKFHGYRKPAEFYGQASIFCMTSTYEGFGMVLTEAMQHGCVPMAFDSYSSVRDIIDDALNGILVTPFDEDEYANKIIRLISDPEKLAGMSREAMIKSEMFSQDKITDRWLELFNKLMK